MECVTRQSFFFLLVLVAFESGLVIVADLKRPFWGDEAHFVETIRQFGDEISMESLKHYNEMSTPLPFIAYAIWGRTFGFDIHILRSLSVLLAIVTYLLFYHLLMSIFARPRTALWATLFLVLHPYMIGLSIFVFTDMMTILFLLMFLISLRRQAPVLLAIFSSAGLLSRQYFAFLPAAAALFCLSGYIQKRDVQKLEMLASIALSFLPMLFLMVLWGGPAPDNEMRDLYLGGGLRFSPSYLALYLCQFVLYLLPIVIIKWRHYFRDMRLNIISLALASLFYWWFPVKPSLSAVSAGVDTVGLFHRFIRRAIGSEYEWIPFFVAFWLSLPILFSIVKDAVQRCISKDHGLTFFLDLSITSFLVIMPFSYLVWEKYFLMVMPLLLIRMLLDGVKRVAPIPP